MRVTWQAKLKEQTIVAAAADMLKKEVTAFQHTNDQLEATKVNPLPERAKPAHPRTLNFHPLPGDG